MQKRKRRIPVSGRSITLIIIIALVFGVISIIKGELFYSLTNISNVFSNLSYDLLLACGMTFVLILGGIDLSVGSVLAFVGIVITMLLNRGLNVALAIVIGLAVAVLAGAINGVIVSKFNVAPFVATLAMMSSLRGACYVLTSGFFVVGLPDSYVAIGRGYTLGIPNKIIISIAIMIFLGIISTRSRVFKQMFYVGQNANAAYLSGISSARTIILGYAMCSLLAGVAAILMTSSFAMGQASFGTGFEMRAIAAAVIGGASMNGGEGNFVGTALGVILVALVNNVFIMFNGSPNWSTAISGIMLLVAVAFDLIRTRKRGESV